MIEWHRHALFFAKWITRGRDGNRSDDTFIDELVFSKRSIVLTNVYSFHVGVKRLSIVSCPHYPSSSPRRFENFGKVIRKGGRFVALVSSI